MRTEVFSADWLVEAKASALFEAESNISLQAGRVWAWRHVRMI